MVNALISNLDNPFWQFSLKLYRHEKVKTACLSFQNQEGVNVNLLLVCCWLSYAIEAISQLEFNQAYQLIDEWHQQVTQPMRQVRQYLKNSQASINWVSHFYQQVLADELSSESYQQNVLFSCFASKQKSEGFFNEELMSCYIDWLFAAMKTSLTGELKLKIRYFIQIVQDILEEN
ncbi:MULTISPECIES: TIGR02444 family protein [Legionella]|uniref:TIGR02444 family protein n=1 Tax=Legionella drozanskii LLAP-1 TaxID=1212489 RepID=A0A0W0SV80_9GAMM|nr:MULTISPECIES: TIGR02444 family protein [Legionella]KTC87288.1 hypothetical protein Ldro_0907 [Legionella drozanskii LLAP-1]PJE17920.1 MAG: TIGR02444 family protein [Legionella sp.]